MFRTPIHIPEAKEKIQLSDRFVALGSCFADTMGRRMLQNKQDVLLNPFGVIFNPLSLRNIIAHSLNNQAFEPQHFIQRAGHSFHLDAHSELFAPSKDALAQQLQQQAEVLKAKWEKAEWICITLGTAWVYAYKATAQIVANCQKVPAAEFEKRLLEVEEITQALGDSTFLEWTKGKQVLFTVSPVRHIKDTLQGNSSSKATLRLAVEKLVQQHANFHYFPSYEIMLDDLRDYRFYAKDMLHISEEAEDYIWEHFTQAYFSKELQAFTQEWEKIRSSLVHKPFQPNSPEHQKFLQSLLQKLEALSPRMDVQQEIAAVKKQLHD